MRGVIIALEGIDGAGTTTQSARLATWLRGRGRDVLQTREPSRGAVGTVIREALRAEGPGIDAHALALLFAADRLDHVAREVTPALARGEIVISDRYVLSSLAYQGIECPEDWVAALNRFAPAPDLTLLLDLDAEVGLARVRHRGDPAERYDRLDVLRRVAARYRDLAHEAGAVVLDGARDVDTVEAAVRREVERVVG
jgi:dTMP kinase